MISRIIYAIAVGLLTAIVLVILGPVIASLGSGPFDAIGHALATYAWVIGFIVALLVFFGGFSLPAPRLPK